MKLVRHPVFETVWTTALTTKQIVIGSMLDALRTATVQYPERSSVSIFIYREVLRTSWQCNGAGLFSETFVARRRGRTSVIRGRLVVSKAIDQLQLCWGPDPRHYHEARKLA